MTTNDTKQKLYALAFSPLDSALIDFYAQKFNASKKDVISGMFRRIMATDETFDEADYIAFVDDYCTKHYNKEETKTIKRHMQSFLDFRSSL